MPPARAKHWQEAWARAGLSTGRRVPEHEKFFALVAYPGTSGFFHVGHLRGYAYADALHRYHRMLGKESLFPFGVHASGLPAVTWAQKVRDRDPFVVGQLEEHGVPPEEWNRLEDPETAARFLGESYRTLLGSLGILVDATTYLTTVDDDYRAFIRWQFRTLHATGALVQGTYFAPVCPVCGPVAVDPSETDLSSGGTAELVRYTTVPFPLEDGRTLLAATLRPETVYGVTSLWLAPRETLVVWHHREAVYVVARPAAERLVEQHGGHVGHAVPSAELLGRSVRVPLRDVSVPILESPIVDPKVGTGVVMSVPAHAPADALAIVHLDAAARAALGDPPVLLEVPAEAPLTPSERELVAGEGTPAERALRATRAESLENVEALREATERLYRLEFVRGRMTVPPYAGVSVRAARDRVAAELAARGDSFDLQEFSIPVICRNGHEVVVRRVPDQWFLHYGDPAWKAETLRRLERLTTYPADYLKELPPIIDWFSDRPCTRRGRWLGSPFPLDPQWIIEPIADSTFYMAYFVVRRFVTTGRLGVEQLTGAFFDYVFRGEGPGEPTVDRTLQDEVRSEFRYWYPLDVNIGGKEHKRVHFPAFLYTHAKLLPATLAPRAIFVHHWVTGPSGDKISKKGVGGSGRRIPSVEGAIDEWGPDALRLFYLLSSSPAQDVEWDSELVAAAADRLEDVARLVKESSGDAANPRELEAWLFSRFHRLVRSVRAAYDRADLRVAAEAACTTVPALLRRFYARGGSAGAAVDRVASAWVRLLSPVAPHLAEELGEGRFAGLVATQRFPSPEEFPLAEDAEAREAFLERVEEDLRAVIHPGTERGLPAPREVVFFVAEPWKLHVERWLREAVDRGEAPSVRAVIERAPSVPEVDAHRPEIAKYVQRVAPLLRAEAPREGPEVDELAALREAEGYLARRFGFESVSVVPESEAASFDPLARRERARPGRPAFYLLRPGSAGGEG